MITGTPQMRRFSTRPATRGPAQCGFNGRRLRNIISQPCRNHGASRREHNKTWEATMKKMTALAALGVLMAGTSLAGAADVTFERLRNPEPQNWLMNHGDFN